MYISALILLASSLNAKPEVTWLQVDWPPHQIVSGPHSGKGTYDLMFKQIVDRLPEFNHTYTLSNLQRVETLFEQGHTGVCTMFGTIKSQEREKERIFSNAVVVGSNLLIAYVSPSLDNYASMQSESVDFDQLASDVRLRGAYQPNREYAPKLKQTLTLAGSNLIAQDFTSEVNAVSMLANGRVDYVIDYPERINFYNSLLKKPVKIHFKPIKDHEDPIVSYISCSKDPIGKLVVDSINEELPGLWRSEAYLFAIRRWLNNVNWDPIQKEIEALQNQM